MATALFIIIVFLFIIVAVIGGYIAYLRLYLGYRQHHRAHAMRLSNEPITPEMLKFDE